MLDDFRQHAYFEDDEEESPGFEDEPEEESILFGLSPAQRLLIAVMLLIMTLLLGSACLLVTGRVVPPFI